MNFDLRRKRTLAGLGVTLAMTLPLSAVAGGPWVQAVNARPMADTVDQLIVKYRNATTATVLDANTLSTASASASSRNLGLRHVRRTALGAHVLRLDRRVSVDEAVALAQEIQAGDFNVEYAEPNRMLHAMFTPNDTFYASQQWDLFEATAGIHMPSAWDTTSGTGVVVAVIDTGYRPHADLAANLVAGHDFISDTTNTHDGDGRDNDARDPGDYAAADECDSSSYTSSWHGTHVAGTIAAVTHNATGIAGIAFGAKVQPVRVLGTCGGTFADIADAIVWAAGGTVSGVPANATPARVINMSLGGTSSCPSTMQSAINTARSLGTVVVVAAGNENSNASTSAPANCTGVIAVAAVGRTGARASYSNFGAIVDLAAPGGDGSNGIYSTLNAGSTTPGADSYAAYQGTSMATPHVAAVAALMLSVNAALTPDDVKSRLKSSARAFPVTCTNGCGSGLLDAAAAVAAAAGVPVPPPPPPPASTPVAEVEPNNSRTSAQAVTPNPATVTGTLGSSSGSSSDNNDYFAISLAAGKTLTATLTPPSRSDFDLYIYRTLTGSAVASSLRDTGAVDTATYTNSGSFAITVYVRAYRYSGSGTYTLGLSQ
jgi:serine protease